MPNCESHYVQPLLTDTSECLCFILPFLTELAETVTWANIWHLWGRCYVQFLANVFFLFAVSLFVINLRAFWGDFKPTVKTVCRTVKRKEKRKCFPLFFPQIKASKVWQMYLAPFTLKTQNKIQHKQLPGGETRPKLNLNTTSPQWNVVVAAPW